MSFRVKLRIKSLKPSLPELIEQAWEYRKALDAARRLPDYPKGNECVPSGCRVCGVKFTDPMGRPVAMGFVCGNTRCPSQTRSMSSGVIYTSGSEIWNGGIQ